MLFRSNRIDLYAFTSEVGENLSFQAKIGILENLFRVACIDQDLDHEEQEAIRKISGLLRIEHKDFIDTKIRIKKEKPEEATSGFKEELPQTTGSSPTTSLF